METFKSEFIHVLKVTALALLLTLGVNFLNAEFSPPTTNAPDCPTGSPGCDPPLNTSTSHQYKLGNVTVGSSAIDSWFKLEVVGDAVISGILGLGNTLTILGAKGYADDFCLNNGTACLSGVSGEVDVGVKYLTGANPSCPAGWTFHSRKFVAKTCGTRYEAYPDRLCTTAVGWVFGVPVCRYCTFWTIRGGCAETTACTADTWTEALCVGG